MLIITEQNVNWLTGWMSHGQDMSQPSGHAIYDPLFGHLSSEKDHLYNCAAT